MHARNKNMPKELGSSIIIIIILLSSHANIPTWLSNCKNQTANNADNYIMTTENTKLRSANQKSKVIGEM